MEQSEFIEFSPCLICGNQHFRKYLEVNDDFLTKELFTLIECTRCGLIVTTPQPASDKLGCYYLSEDYISHSNKNSDLISKMYQTVRSYTLNKKVSLLKKFTKGKHVLDIGCATGEFLKHCSERGFIPTGIEPDENARTYGLENYNLDVKDLLEMANVEDASFDVITQWHVLEHVSDINQRMAEVYRLLKSDGIAIIALPNPASHDASYYGNRWAAYDVPRHLFHFTQKAFKALAEKHQFEIIEIKPMLFDSYYVSILSEKHIHGKTKYIPAFWRGLISNMKAGASNLEYSSLIYIIRKKWLN